MVILFGVVQNFYTISHNNRFLLIQRMLSKWLKLNKHGAHLHMKCLCQAAFES
jgi:hypothetical protein